MEPEERFLTALEEAEQRGPLLRQLGGSELLVAALLALREHLTEQTGGDAQLRQKSCGNSGPNAG